MVSIERKKLELTLEALWTSAGPKVEEAITAIKEALAQPHQEPASTTTYKEVTDTINSLRRGGYKQAQLAQLMENAKLYTTPPKRPWVGLTDEEIEIGRDQTFSTNNPYCPCDSKTMRKAVRWAEAKLKEKNT